MYGGALLAADEETFSGRHLQPSPLLSLLGLEAAPEIDVLSETNAPSYWDRSDSFDMAIDLTAGRRGLAALGEVIRRWIAHLLAIDISVEAVSELHATKLTWYVGFRLSATRLGDRLWRGEDLDRAERELIVGLYRLMLKGAPVYLIAATDRDMTLRFKPQNLIVGLPL